MYLFNSAPMTRENQHYILCPDHEGAMKAEAVYAPSPEAAVELVQGLYKVGDFGEPLPEASVGGIRIATGAELPWNDGAHLVTVVFSLGVIIEGMTVEEAKSLYANEARPATPAEREDYFRTEAVRQDIEGEEQFNQGFNVDYKTELEARLDA